MSDYIKCPRCELNYIHKDQQYCEICKAELGLGPELIFAVEKEKEERFKLCPICKQVNIAEDEEMCDKCRENIDFKDDQIDYDNDEGWKTYVNDDEEEEEEEEGEEISFDELEEEEDLDKDEFEEEFYQKEDFEYVDPDDPTLLDDDEDEEGDDDDFGDE